MNSRNCFRYREFEEEKKVYDNLDKAFESKTLNLVAQISQDNSDPSKFEQWRHKIFVFLEEPMSSKPAQVSR